MWTDFIKWFPLIRKWDTYHLILSFVNQRWFRQKLSVLDTRAALRSLNSNPHYFVPVKHHPNYPSFILPPKSLVEHILFHLLIPLIILFYPFLEIFAQPDLTLLLTMGLMDYLLYLQMSLVMTLNYSGTLSFYSVTTHHLIGRSKLKFITCLLIKEIKLLIRFEQNNKLFNLNVTWKIF